MQVIAGASDRSEKWLAGLDKSGLAGGLRALTLEARVAADRDQQADIEALVEPRANELLSSAGKPADQAAVSEAIGQLYTSLKQHALAERWYRRLVELAPAQYALLAGSLTRQERLADAITVCGEATKTDATTRPAMVLVAALTEGRPSEQDFKQAAPIIAAAVAKFPADVDLLYAVTLVNLLEGKHDDAIRHYRQILASNPRHVAALNNLAMLLAERPADRAEALRLVDLAIEIVGKDPGLLDTKGAILVYSSRPAEALPLLLSATRGESADPRHHLHLAVAYRDLGQLDEAKAQLKIALDRNLDRQLLMPTDQRLLAEMRAQLLP
jgi:tetratricopeptide (TPR) repeat protein